MVAAHPFRGAHNLVRWDSTDGVVLNLEEAMDRPIFEVVDSLEVFNGMAADWEIDLCSAVCDNLLIAGTAGSDAHNIEAVGDCVTVLDKKVDNEEAFLHEMRQKKYLAHCRVRNRIYPNNGAAHFPPED